MSLLCGLYNTRGHYIKFSPHTYTATQYKHTHTRTHAHTHTHTSVCTHTGMLTCTYAHKTHIIINRYNTHAHTIPTCMHTYTVLMLMASHPSSSQTQFDLTHLLHNINGKRNVRINFNNNPHTHARTHAHTHTHTHTHTLNFVSN